MSKWYNGFMLNIDIKELKEIKEELDELHADDAIFVEENGDTKFVILPIEQFDELESYRDLLDGKVENGAAVKIVSNQKNELTYEEYEKIRKQLVDIFDKTFKPNPEKLN